jgi:hypothetical protein
VRRVLSEHKVLRVDKVMLVFKEHKVDKVLKESKVQ